MVCAPADDHWPERWTEDKEKFVLNNNLLIPKNWVEDTIDHWQNTQLMHPGRDYEHKDLELRLRFGTWYFRKRSILNDYF